MGEIVATSSRTRPASASSAATTRTAISRRTVSPAPAPTSGNPTRGSASSRTTAWSGPRATARPRRSDLRRWPIEHPRSSSASVETIRAGQSPRAAYVASPNFAPYGFSWLRDGSFIADAMSRAGESRTPSVLRLGGAIVEAGRLRRALHPRRRAGASNWPHRQHDGWGLWLWAMRSTASVTEAAPLAEAARRGRRGLEQVRYEPCADWWEEREGVHAATLACIAAGLAPRSIFRARTSDSTAACSCFRASALGQSTFPRS